MQLPVKPYIKNRLKTSYAVEGPETQYTIDCGDGVNVMTVSEAAVNAVRNMDFREAQVYQHTITMKETIQRYWSDYISMPLHRISLGEGSQSLLYDTCRLFLEPGDKVTGIAPCYADLSSDIGMWGADYDYVPLRYENNYRFDTEEFIGKLDSSLKLVYIDTPNNPTGQAVPIEDITRIVERAAELSLPIIIDEAYGDYLDMSQSAITIADKFENLVVLRSFSKAHGLAGARAGYAIMPEQLCVPLDNITHPYICSGPSRVVACAALEDNGFLERTRKITAELKKPFLDAKWKHLTASYTHTDTPIFLLTHEDPNVNLKKEFDKYHIKVSDGSVFAGISSNSARLRVPLAADQKAVLDAIAEIDEKS